MALLAFEELARALGGAVVLDGVDLELRRAEILGLLGGIGGGKTTLARMVSGLERADSGRVLFDGVDLLGLSPRQRRLLRLRGALQLVSQDPYASLSPRLTVAQAVAEPLRVRGHSSGDHLEAAREALGQVGLAPDLLRRYPRDLSGGERQRVALARALVPGPSLIIADEPVSMLDTTSKAGILSLLAALRDERGLCVLLISHDVRVAAHLCDRVAVLHRGKVVEVGPTRRVLSRPDHPYTARLVAAAPKLL